MKKYLMIFALTMGMAGAANAQVADSSAVVNNNVAEELTLTKEVYPQQQEDGDMYHGLSRKLTFDHMIPPHGLEVTYDKTVHILFPSEVRYVDLGSPNLIAGTAEGLSTSGAHDTDFYGVYVLNNNDYGWKPSSASDKCSGDPAKIRQTAASMEAYFDAKISEGYDKPIFVAAHIPLHSSYRTRAHGENVYAKYIFDVINEAGKSLNIIYLFGHNHSASSDSYIGGGSAYLGRGETIFIPQLGKKDATPTQETLNFTYMNAGYVGYVRNENAGGNELTVSVFEITGNKVEVKRYTRNGITNVRAAGGLYTGAGETAATYGMTTADFNEYMNPSYKTATITAPSVVSDGAINGQWVEIPSYTATAYYQTFQFVEDGVYLIANYGDGTGTWSALQETSKGNVSSTAVTIQKNERGYFITLPDASTANQKEWTFDGFCVNKFATVGSLKNGYTGRYLQADEGGTQGLSLQVVSGNPFFREPTVANLFTQKPSKVHSF